MSDLLVSNLEERRDQSCLRDIVTHYQCKVTNQLGLLHVRP